MTSRLLAQTGVRSPTIIPLAAAITRALSIASLALGVLGFPAAAQTTFNVTASGFSDYIINGAPDPTLTLTRGVAYTFNVNASGHPFWIKTVPGTGTLNAYNTGVVNNGTNVGTITFNVPANAPATLFYNCQFHSAMAGTINIIDPPQPHPPLVALTNPPTGITLAAPADVTLRASASDSDGTVTNVQFFSGATLFTLLGNDTSSPYSLTLTNLPAGQHKFTARATDNSGLSATSLVVNVSVVTPGTIRFDTNLLVASGQLPLRLFVTPSLSYQLDYSATLTDWLLFTNFVATNATMNFSAPVAAPRALFRARLLPNP